MFLYMFCSTDVLGGGGLEKLIDLVPINDRQEDKPSLAKCTVAVKVLFFPPSRLIERCASCVPARTGGWFACWRSLLC